MHFSHGRVERATPQSSSAPKRECAWLWTKNLNLHLRHPRKSLQQHSRLEFSYECKRLMADADLTSARFLARLALAAAPTLKWLLVTIALHLPIAGTKLLNRINA